MTLISWVSRDSDEGDGVCKEGHLWWYSRERVSRVRGWELVGATIRRTETCRTVRSRKTLDTHFLIEGLMLVKD